MAQTEWSRAHHLVDGHIVTASAHPDRDYYRADIDLDESSHSSIFLYCPDLDTARTRADELVQKAHPHDCARHRCGEWMAWYGDYHLAPRSARSPGDERFAEDVEFAFLVCVLIRA